MTLPGPVICIVGPTASGKSAIAELVAARLGSEVVSIDAMQVYRGMDIGTAKTPIAERRVPLLMVDVCEPGCDYSVQLFQREARSCVDGLLDQGRIPVLAGGTGLYLNAVIDEMDFPAGEKGTETRSSYEAIVTSEGPETLYELLVSRDPASAALIHPHNTKRVVRALELLDEGVSYAENNKGLHERAAHYNATLWGLTMGRERLYDRIERRVDLMFEEGLVEEVRGLVACGLTKNVTAGQAIGYKEVLAYLSGDCSLQEAIDEVKKRTRHYAKRQLSWFRRDGRVQWLDLDSLTPEDAAAVILGSLESGGSNASL